MDGNDDRFPTPDPDPSLEELLRRARDARLANDWGPAAGRSPARDNRFTRRLPGWASFLVGLAVGLALASLVSIHGVLTSQLAVGGPTAPPAPPPATTTPLPTPTATPTDTPTPSPTPTAPPPTTAAIVALVQAFYDNQGPYAGTYVLQAVTNMRIEDLDNGQLAVCVAYDAAAVTAPDTVVASNVRLFTLSTMSDGTWRVVQMGGSGSCSLG